MIDLGKSIIKTPVFFPSISSIKTNLKPLDYLRLLVASKTPCFLISAYDIFNELVEEKNKIIKLLSKAKMQNQIVLLDSGNYEKYWAKDSKWTKEEYYNTLKYLKDIDIAFIYDEQYPPIDSDKICNIVSERILQQEDVSIAFTAPIVHADFSVLIESIYKVADRFQPLLLAVPERILGEGLIERANTVYKIVMNLKEHGITTPLHLLGTGNPLSILAYTACGAASYDGLEWCQTTVNYETAMLYHFQQRELFVNYKKDNDGTSFSYTTQTLTHNLNFYIQWMENIRKSIEISNFNDLLKQYFQPDLAAMLIDRFIGVRK